MKGAKNNLKNCNPSLEPDGIHQTSEVAELLTNK